MKRIWIAVAVFVCCHAYCIDLEGTWVSDKDKTLEWNKSNLLGKLPSNLHTVLGHHYITYENGLACSYFEPYLINEQSNGGFSLPHYKYKEIVSNSSGYIISQIFDDQEEFILMYKFEGSSSIYGVGLDSDQYGIEGYREYYKKIDKTHGINWNDKSCYPEAEFQKTKN